MPPRSVAQSPGSVAKLTKLGFKVNVESGAGLLSDFRDADFQSAGAKIVSTAEALQADIVCKVRAPSDSELEHMKSSSILISTIFPGQNKCVLPF